MVDPTDEKTGFTVAVCIRGGGIKLPAVIIFQGAVKTHLLSAKILLKLGIPPNVVVKSLVLPKFGSNLD